MGYDDRKKLFEAAARKLPLYSSSFKEARGYGASNALMIVDSGLELLDADLAGVKAEHDGFLLFAGTLLPPNDELYVAVYIKSDAENFKNRLDEMVKNGVQEQELGSKNFHSQKNNNTAILVSRNDGQLYFRNKGHWNGDSSEIDLSLYGNGIKADRVSVAVYPPSRDASRSLNVRTYISFLSKIFRQDKIHEIHPWESCETDFESFKVQPASLDIHKIKERIKNLGCYYNDNIVEQFHFALNYLQNKHFVILAGLSGSGKTSLAIRYSQAIHGIVDPMEKDPFMFMCRVRPDWTDPSGLIGYPDIVSGKYIVPEFLEAILTAHAYPDIPVFVCLDEMNLARVEYYFSDLLSCVESAPESDITLHHNSVPMEGSNGEDIPSSIPVPTNIYVIGTINIDETTNPLSDKILDRASVVDMSNIDIDGFLKNIKIRNELLSDSVNSISDILINVYKILFQYQFGFGYRVIEEVVMYYDFAKKSKIKPSAEIIDHLLSQKILTKLRGTEQHRSMLISLQDVLRDYPVAVALLKRLLADIDEMGGFQALR